MFNRFLVGMKDLTEACGIFGVYDFDHESIYPYVYWGLLSQNHRGHQSHGMLTYDGLFHAHKALGLVPRMKNKKMRKWSRRLPGHIGIGNVRYATSGRMDSASLGQDIQPTIAESGKVSIAISYNGNIVNVSQLKAEVSRVLHLESTSDAELLCKKLCLEFENCGDLSEAVKRCMLGVEGAYSTIGITNTGEFFAFRDPAGIKPLCFGFSKDKEAVAFASESVGLDINDLHYFLSYVAPGELIRVTDERIQRVTLVENRRKALCSFEFAYFARPDSILNGANRYVYEIRRDFGRHLGHVCQANQSGSELEVVIPVPESANDAAYGFHMVTELPLEHALRRHRYVTDRAFISTQKERGGILNKKINVLENVISGKKIALIDDSIVRGDTAKNIIQKMRAAGAETILLYLTFPKIISPCFYGIDMATFSELIGTTHSPTEVASIIGADSVIYPSLDEFIKAIGLHKSELCLACLTGTYPTPLAQELADEQRMRFEQGTRETGRIYEQPIHR
jgi:amidophosphoribosyltransferase